ncbi:MAG: hypothetical protein HWE19_01750 [Vibrionaceae bacterium]|nr:hypothetical protein [Vibrionaceae bacterium]
MTLNRLFVLSICSVLSAASFANSYSYDDIYSAQVNPYSFEYEQNNDWYAPDDCLSNPHYDADKNRDFVTPNGSKCYVRKIPKADAQTYLRSDADGSFGAGFIWNFED